MTRGMKMPDFAGTALVDILANGLAMLIIVIVLSISARGEREQRTASQVEEVETMMSRRFSTSLVLNSLAASPPARLHDYRASPLDQQYDPQILPILEFHRGFVREFYSGTIWSREQLLRKPNTMDDWLTGFDEERKLRLRADVYDIAQFYLVMSILRDHGISVRHWHFLSGGLGLDQVGHCPAGVAAQDCGTGGTGATTTPTLPTLAQGGGDGEATWPPAEFASGADEQVATDSNPFPGAATLGPLPGGTGFSSFADGNLGDNDGLAASFPNARPGRSLSSSQQSLGTTANKGLRFRLSSPESLRPNSERSLGLSNPDPSIEQVLTVLFDFIGKLQAILDAGASPSNYLVSFEQSLGRAFATLPRLDEATRTLISTLIWDVFQNLAQDPVPDLNTAIQPYSADQHDRQLEISTLELSEQANTALIIEPNKRLQQVAVGRARDDAQTLPEAAAPVLRLNSYPDVWRGLALPLEWHSMLLMPLQQQHPEQLRWRAVAYIAPKFDDFIIGFVYAAVAADGRLLVQAEDNRASLNGRPLLTAHRQPLFGTRAWLVTLYAMLALCLLACLLLVRRVSTRQSSSTEQQ